MKSDVSAYELMLRKHEIQKTSIHDDAVDGKQNREKKARENHKKTHPSTITRPQHRELAREYVKSRKNNT